jgi:AcrR family transcriptional regulator
MGEDGPMTTATPTGERVEEILAAACRVVVREGAHGVRMASVALEAGVSKALVHYYFTTRQELLRSAFAWSDERWQSSLSDTLAKLPTGAQRLERALLMSIDTRKPYGDQRALWNEVWSSLRFDDEIRPVVDASYRAWLKRLASLIEDGHRDGSIPSMVDPIQAAWRLAAVGDGLDSMLYLGLLGREKARTLMLGGIRRELAGP